MLLLSPFFLISTYTANIIFIDFVPITPIKIPGTTPKDPQLLCPSINGKLSTVFQGILFVFGVVSVLYRYFLSKKPRRDMKIYKDQLKSGVGGLILCSIALKIGFWYLSKNFIVGFITTLVIQLFSMGIVLSLILPGVCAIEVAYKQWKEYLGFVGVLTVVISYASMSFMGSQIDLIVHLIYTISISVYIIDIHVLSCNQFRVISNGREETEMEKRQTAQENHLFLGDSFMV